jgi:hypothetical protein
MGMSSKRFFKVIGCVCLMLLWFMNTAAMVGAGSQVVPAPLQLNGIVDLQSMGSPYRLAYNWTKHLGHSAGETSAASVRVDRWGNIYISGQFNGTVNFDPAGDNPDATFTSYNNTVDAYLLKLDANGQYQWVKTWGAGVSTPCASIGRACGRDAANGVVVDAAGNAYVAGLFQNTVNFGNGHTAVSNAPNGSNNIFLTKFDASGVNQWVRAWGGTTGGEAYSLAIDTARGYVFVQGDWSTYPSNGTVDFNPGGTGGLRANHGKKDSFSSGFDAFLSKYDLNGNFQWARTWGGNQYDDGPGVAVDETTGNVYVCGMYGSQNINFDPSEDPLSNGAHHPASDDSSMLLDIFLTSFDTEGNWRWVRTWGGPGYEDSGATVAVDRTGNVYAIARFGCQDCNFNVGANGPLSPSIPHSAWGKFDLAISKFDANGNYLWSQSWGGPLIDQPGGLVVDEMENVYVSGMVNVTRSELTYQILTSTASLSKIASDGTLEWNKTWGGGGTDSAGSPWMDGAGNLYVVGQFQNTIDFNPDSGVDNISTRGVLDASVTRYLAERSVTAQAGAVVNVWTGGTTTMVFPVAVAPITITATLTNTPLALASQSALGPAIIVNAADVDGVPVDSLAAPFTLTVNYMPSDAARFNGSTLRVNYWDEQSGVWQAVNTEVDTDTRTLTAQVSQMGMFAVFGELGPRLFLPLIYY